MRIQVIATGCQNDGEYTERSDAEIENISKKLHTSMQTEADIVNYAVVTGDWHPLHTDVEYASKTPFKSRIDQRILTLCVGMDPHFGLGSYSFMQKYFIAFYGMENLCFKVPNRMGHAICCSLKLEESTIEVKTKGY